MEMYKDRYTLVNVHNIVMSRVYCFTRCQIVFLIPSMCVLVISIHIQDCDTCKNVFIVLNYKRFDCLGSFVFFFGMGNFYILDEIG